MRSTNGVCLAWLRISPEHLRVLYEGSVDKKWTMVGEITHFPKLKNIHENTNSSLEMTSDQVNIKDEISAMKDVLHTVFKSIAEMKGSFFESTKRVELRVRPLAIYQEAVVRVGEVLRS